MSPDIKRVEQEKPLKDKKVYFSSSMKGVLNAEPDFVWNFVQFMLTGGAKVLDTHVAGRNQPEIDRLFIEDNGFDAYQREKPWVAVEEVDMAQVDEADYFVSIVNSASHGVGTEIQRAIDNYEMRGKKTEILCLIQEDLLPKLSFMVRGKEKPKYPIFHLQTYKNLEDAEDKVLDFLTTH